MAGSLACGRGCLRSVARVEQGQKLNDKPRGKLAYLLRRFKEAPVVGGLRGLMGEMTFGRSGRVESHGEPELRLRLYMLLRTRTFSDLWSCQQLNFKGYAALRALS